jgi:two-component system response regulator (stage 0 sporulation protein A)
VECYYGFVKETEIKIKKYLLSLGFQPNLKGYHLLSRLIERAMEGESIMPLKYQGYLTLSKEFCVGAESIEKDIQNAISAAWLRGDVDILYREFGETLDENKGKPTNKQFVLTALERLN